MSDAPFCNACGFDLVAREETWRCPRCDRAGRYVEHEGKRYRVVTRAGQVPATARAMSKGLQPCPMCDCAASRAPSFVRDEPNPYAGELWCLWCDRRFELSEELWIVLGSIPKRGETLIADAETSEAA